MLKGLAITPPIIGRISIGRVVEKNGKRLPEKDDQFTLTTQVQNRDGWVLHPLNESLRKAAPGKLRSIPVRLLFNDPTLNLRAEYTLFDRETGRPVCVGNGERCKRVVQDGIAILPCPRRKVVSSAARVVASRMGGSTSSLGTKMRWARSSSVPPRSTQFGHWLRGCVLQRRVRRPAGLLGVGTEAPRQIHHAELPRCHLLRRSRCSGGKDAGGYHHRGTRNGRPA